MGPAARLAGAQCLAGWMVLGMLMRARNAQAACSEGTFDAVCICLDDEACISTAHVSSTQNCSCEGGRDLSLESTSSVTISMEFSSGGGNRSIYLSGQAISVLQPYAAVFEGAALLSIALKNTSVASLQILDGLQSMRSIQLIANRLLTNVNGLDRLEMLTGDARIHQNRALRNLDGFSGLTKLGGMLHIAFNDMLASISGLGRLQEVGELLWISSNAALENVSVFEDLRAANSIFVDRNDAITDISGFKRLKSIGDRLTIHFNTALRDVSGFENLATVGGYFDIRFNGALRAISGLKSLKTVGSMQIEHNGALEEIDGFRNLEIVQGALEIQANGVLRGISGFKALEKVGGGIQIAGNGIDMYAASRLLDFIGNTQVLCDFGGDSGTAIFSVTGGVGPYLVPESRGICSQNVLTSTSISGFSSLSVVDGILSIASNPTLIQVSGFNTLANVTGSLIIESNHNLTNISGIGNLSRQTVVGELLIERNPSLSTLEGFSSLSNVNGDLIIEANENLLSINGFQNLGKVNGTALIKGNPSLQNITGLGSLVTVTGNLTILQEEAFVQVDGGFGQLTFVGNDLDLIGINMSENAFPRLESVLGSLLVKGSHFGKFRGKRHPNLHTVGRSLRIVSNNFDNGTDDLSFDMFPKLVTVCEREVNGTECGLVIEGNSHYQSIHKFSFSNLVTLSGGLVISRNGDLQSIEGFQKLEHVRAQSMVNSTIRDLFVCFGGMIIASNPDLASITGFGALKAISGVLAIFRNPMLARIKMRELSSVTSFTNIALNNARLQDFTSPEQLPHVEEGCRMLNHTVPNVDSGTKDGPVFVTKLVRAECDVERLLPTLVGAAIIFLMTVVSVVLFRYLVLNFYHPHRQRTSVDSMKDMFAAHLLALADVLSDLGFIVTVFILWDTKGREVPSALFFIGLLSAFVLISSQVYMIVGVHLGLHKRSIGAEAQLWDSTGTAQTLFEHLKNQEGFTAADKFILFFGLLVLDAEVVKHLPFWKRGATENPGAFQGFPHKHFADVAFVAGILEDLPQIMLQIFFLVIIEDDDGWVITGAMASLTLSVADAMVRFVFPMLARLYMSRESHLTREDAMRIQREDPIGSGNLDIAVSPGSGQDHNGSAMGNGNMEVAMSILGD